MSERWHVVCRDCTLEELHGFEQSASRSATFHELATRHEGDRHTTAYGRVE